MTTLSFLVPKSRRLVLLGAMNGRWYGDNARHLFEWLLTHRKDLRPVWLTASDTVHAQLTHAGKPVAKIRSLRALWLLLRARAGAFTNSLSDLAASPYLVPRQLQLVALRHGRSVKRVRFARLGHPLPDAEAQERRREANLIRYAISTSEFTSDMQEACLQIGRHKHVVTGYPRNDRLLAPDADMTTAWRRFIGDHHGRRVVLYAPSWRHGREATRFFPFEDFSPERLQTHLQNTNTLLLLRPHANDLLRYPDLCAQLRHLAEGTPHIRLATHDVFHDVNSLIPFVSALITDYSALYHDFLLLDRPILFIPYDLAAFEQQNGFLYDYLAHLPGPDIGSFQALLAHLDALATGTDAFREQRHALRDLIHTHQGADACARVAKRIESLLSPTASRRLGQDPPP